MKNEEYVYQKNIKVIKEFYNSDYYKTLKGKTLQKNIISEIYIDPDNSDELLYKDLSEKLGLKYVYGNLELYDNEIRLAADAVCGWKQLYDLKDGNIEWLNYYEEMRKCTSAYLVWPRHKSPTINTLRYAVFRDRVDYTLYDISKFFYYKGIFDEDNNEETFEKNVKNNCSLYKAYFNKGTHEWLLSFDGFKEFIDKMKLEMFVNFEYKVFDLDKDDNSIISNYCSVYSFNEKYLSNLKSKISTENIY